MVPVGENAAVPLRDAVHGARDPCPDRFHAAPKRVTVGRFDDEMGVIALERVVREAKSGSRAACGKAALELAHDRDGAQ